MKSGFVYILECSNESLYTGSTIDLERRLQEHIDGLGANHTIKYPPKKLLYTEEYPRIDLAFKREKQIQRWGRDKKLALIDGRITDLKLHAQCKNESHFKLWNDKMNNYNKP